METTHTSNSVVEVSDETFTAAVLDASSERPVLVDFGAPWCGPCRAMDPVVHALATEYAGRIGVAKINTDNSPRLAAQYEVLGMPTFVLFRDGSEVFRLTGARPKADLKRVLDSALATPASAHSSPP